LAGAVLAQGCRDPSGPPSDLDTTISPLEQWCGGTIAITAERYRTMDPTFVVGNDTLVTARQNVTTLTATLPTSCAELSIVEHSAAGVWAIGTVSGRGFIEHYDMTPGLIGDLSPWPRGVNNAVIGASPDGVAILTPASRLWKNYPGIHSTGGHYRSVGTSHVPQRAFLQDPTTGTGLAWILGDQAVRDTLTVPAFGTPYHVMEPGPGIWMVSGAHTVSVYGANYVEARIEGNRGMRLSPDGRHATVLPNGTSMGVPVFDAATGDLRYWVGDIWRVNDAAFSPDDSLLFFAGNVVATGTQGSLVAVAAGTGAVRYQVALGDHQALSLVADPTGRFVFVATAPSDTLANSRDIVTVLVFQARDGTKVGELSAPDQVPECRSTCEGLLLYDHWANALFFVDGGDDRMGTRVYLFDALSSLQQNTTGCGPGNLHSEHACRTYLRTGGVRLPASSRTRARERAGTWW
jgi:hypothetical protein